MASPPPPPPPPPHSGPSRGRPVELLVAHVPSRTTEVDLVRLFAEVSGPGEVRGVTFHGPGALVRLRSEAGAERAAGELDGRPFRGIRLSVRRFHTFKIFVALLPESCTSQELQELFEEFGPVVECSIVRDYAFVHMVNEEDARAAIEHLNGREVKGRRIVVEASKGNRSSHHFKEAAETKWNHYPAPSYRNQPSASLGVDNRAQPSTGRSAAHRDQAYASHSDTSYKSKFSAPPRSPSSSARASYGAKMASSHDLSYEARSARSSAHLLESYEDELAFGDESVGDEGSYSLSEQSVSYGPSYRNEATGGRAAIYKKLGNNGASYKLPDSLSTRSRASTDANYGAHQPTEVPGYRAHPVHGGLIQPAPQDVSPLRALQSEMAARDVPYERVRLSPPPGVHDDYYGEFSVADKQYASKPGAASALRLRYEHVRLSPPRISREDLSYRGASASKLSYAPEAEAGALRQPYERVRLSPPRSSHSAKRRRHE